MWSTVPGEVVGSGEGPGVGPVFLAGETRGDLVTVITILSFTSHYVSRDALRTMSELRLMVAQ